MKRESIMRYDLHIHSALSPCADNDMTVNNIVNMAILNNLDLIAISDHNSLAQQTSFASVAKGKIKILYGVELQTKEEVHVLAYFYEISQVEKMQGYIDEHLIKQENDVDYFGHQYILNEKDEIIKEEKILLISSLDESIETISHFVHELGGYFVLAHALGRSNSVITQLGFIPFNLCYDAIEVKNEEQHLEIMKSHPWIKSRMKFLYNSDAHRLGDIGSCSRESQESELGNFLRKAI
ncbi:MAG: PHP domain-containing protein [Erysipelotrichaceae bacterium]